MTEESAVVGGDARQLKSHFRALGERIGKALPTDEPFVTATVTSPPYGDLIDYGVEGQIGYRQSKAEYLRDCGRLFEDIYAVTKNDGVLWLVADSYVGGSPHNNGVAGLNPLPFSLASLAEQAGWTLREVIIWQKDKTRPWNHHGKLRNAFEYVLLLVKGPDFKFRAGRLRENNDLARWWVRYPERYNVFGKIPDNVWQIPIPLQGSWAGREYQHACPLPPELVRRMLLLTTDEGDLVLDPFAGIGTVPAVAGALKRKGLGVELNPEFVASFDEHVREEIFSRIEVSSSTANGPSAETIASLRLLKFPKALFAKFREVHPTLPMPTLVVCDADEFTATDIKGSAVGHAEWVFVVPPLSRNDRRKYETLLIELSANAPFSKFGVRGRISVVSPSTVRRRLAGRDWNVYEHGRTWNSEFAIRGVSALRLPMSKIRGHFPPLVSNIHMAVQLQHVGDSALVSD